MWTPWRKHKKNAQDMAWLVRAAFELGYRCNGTDWRKDWKNSKPRATLVAMGYVNKEDEYR